MEGFRKTLGEQVNRFTAQAVELDRRDRELVAARDRALRLQLTASKLEQGTEALTAEIELILQHQDQLHSALSTLERRVEEEGRQHVGGHFGREWRALSLSARLAYDGGHFGREWRALLTGTAGTTTVGTFAGTPSGTSAPPS